MEERLQKILSRAGFGSRRECEEFIAAQRVTVNGETAILGMKVDPDRDQIRVDGITINFQEPEKIYVAVNKPRFVLSDRADNDARQTVYQLVPNSETLFVVGRLDFESEGLVLMTNDGDLANKLTHPRFEKEKEYKVLVAKRPDTRQLSAWQRGVILEDGEKTAPANVSIARTQGDGAWLRVIMHEGRKREIREICRAIGLPIVKLIRVRIGTLLLGKLEPREWRWLKPQEVKELKDLVAKKTPPLKPKPASARRPAPRRSSSEKTAASSRFEDRRNERFSPNPDRNEARPSRAPYRAGSKPYPRREPFDRSEPNERGGEFRERSGRNEARSSRAPYRAGSKPYPRREPFDRSEPNERGGEFHERSGRNEARPSRAPYRAGSKPYPRREPFGRSEPNERGGEFHERSGRNEARPSRAPYRAGSKPYPRREPFGRSEPNERGGEFHERSGRNEARSSRAPYRAGSKPYPRREPFDRSKPNERGGEFRERTGKENRSSEKRSSGKRGGRF